jgi:uncharacterized protein involved in exopolysaccharide biosynthesis
VDVQVNTAMLAEMVKNLEAAKMTLEKETPLIQVIDSPILPLKKEKIGRLKTTVTLGLLAGCMVIIFLLGRLWLRTMINGPETK